MTSWTPWSGGPSDRDWEPLSADTFREELQRSHPRYAVERLLGHGGMGAVYVAHDRDVDRPVAIKMLRPDALADDLYLRRFDDEVASLRRLHHANTVRILDAGTTDDGYRFFVMDLLRGETLAQKLAGPVRMPLQRVVEMMKDVCAGVQHVHDQGLVHRDLKAGNVFITEDGRAVVLDFGVARQTASGPSTVTRLYGTPGTYGHIAPEVRRGQLATAVSDVFSLGVVFLQMVTGEIPEIGHRLPSDFGLDPRLDAVARKAVSQDPAERYRSASQFAAAIESAVTLVPPESAAKKINATAEPPPASPYFAGEIQLPFDSVTFRILHDQATAVVAGVHGEIAAVDLRTGIVTDPVRAEETTRRHPGGGEITYVGDAFFFLELAPTRQCFYTMSHSGDLKTWIFDGSFRLLSVVPLLAPHFATLRDQIDRKKRGWGGWSCWSCYSGEVPPTVPEGIMEAKVSPDGGSIVCLTDWFALFRCDLAGRLRDTPTIAPDTFAVEPANSDGSDCWVWTSRYNGSYLGRISFQSRSPGETTWPFYAGDNGIYSLQSRTSSIGVEYGPALKSAELSLSIRSRPIVLSATRRLVAASWNRAQSYELDTLRMTCEAYVAGHNDEIRSLDATWDEAHLVSLAKTSLRIWDVKTQAPVGGHPSADRFLRHNIWGGYPTFPTRDGNVCIASGGRIAVINMVSRSVQCLENVNVAGTMIGVASNGHRQVHVLSVDDAAGLPENVFEKALMRWSRWTPPRSYRLHHSRVTTGGLDAPVCRELRLSGQSRTGPSVFAPSRWFPIEHSVQHAVATDVGDGRAAVLVAGHLAIYDTMTKAIVAGPVDISTPPAATFAPYYYSKLKASPDGFRLFVRGPGLPVRVYDALNLNFISVIPQTTGELRALVPWTDSRHVLYFEKARDHEGGVFLRIADSSPESAGVVGTICRMPRYFDGDEDVTLLGPSVLAMPRWDKVTLLNLITGEHEEHLAPISHVSSVHVCPHVREIMTVSDGFAQFWSIEGRVEDSPAAAAAVLSQARERGLADADE